MSSTESTYTVAHARADLRRTAAAFRDAAEVLAFHHGDDLEAIPHLVAEAGWLERLAGRLADDATTVWNIGPIDRVPAYLLASAASRQSEIKRSRVPADVHVPEAGCSAIAHAIGLCKVAV